MKKIGRQFPIQFLPPILILSSIFFQSCGTAHHFVPYRALEKGEKQITFTWHYDLNGLDLPTIFPDLNYYVGMGDGRNIGFGYNPPIFFSHFTFAKYHEVEENKRWAYYFHLNQLFSSHRNPYFEIGAMHISRTNNSYQQVSVGLAYGRSCNCGTFVPLVQRERKYTKYSRIMPVLKYAITGRDFGASLSYYNGFTKSAMSPFADTLKNKNDTILSIETNQIDSIIYFQNGRFNSETWKIYLKDDTSTIAITRYFPKYGPYGCVFFIPFYRNVDSPLDKETDPGMVQVQSKHGFINSPVRIKMSEFLHKLKIEDTVHLTAYPDQSHNNLLKPNSLINDLSFGIGISAYPKNK